MKCEDKILIRTMQEMFDYFDDHMIPLNGSDVKFLVEAAEMLVLLPDMETLVAALSLVPNNKLTVNQLASYVEICRLKHSESDRVQSQQREQSEATVGYDAILHAIENLVSTEKNQEKEMLTPAMLCASLKIVEHNLYTPALRLLVTTLTEVYSLRERTGLTKLSSRDLVPYLQIRFTEYFRGTPKPEDIRDSWRIQLDDQVVDLDPSSTVIEIDRVVEVAGSDAFSDTNLVSSAFLCFVMLNSGITCHHISGYGRGATSET
jgi:hypothetical protein